MTVAYPLQWPEHIRRSDAHETDRFKATLAKAIENVETSVRRFATDTGLEVTGFVVSSNVSLTDRRPADPGVSVWFTWDNTQVCIPIDRYKTVEANLQAIHHIIEARRTELRHGTLELVRASFKGFAALPPPDKATHGGLAWWRGVLEIGPTGKLTAEELSRSYRNRAKDINGRDWAPEVKESALKELNRARDAARKEWGL